MKRSSLVIVAALLCGIGTAEAQNTVYWDRNDTAPGATNPAGVADGNWNAGDANWNPVADGTGTPATWVAGDHAVFSAGNDVGTVGGLIDGAFVTITGTQTAASILIEEGYTAFRGGTADVGTGVITINSGATLDIDTSIRLNSTGGGKVVLSGGHLKQTNPGNAGSFISATKAIEINGTGIVSYDDGSTANLFVSAYNGVISGVGGTPANGGTGTLIKRGPDRLAQAGQANYAFAKLVVEEGLYQIRTPTAGVDTGLGAVPINPLTDAVTLNGGQIGSNGAITIHANRGITIGPNGGAYNGAALESGGGVFTQLSPLSGSGTFRVFGGGGFRIQNTTSVNTFTGSVDVDGGTLFLDESLSPAGLIGDGGTVTIATGKTLTVGSGNGTDSYAGTVGGPGGLTKVGTGTQTLASTVAGGYGGDTRIQAGTLSFTTPNLANAADVYLTTGAALNLNFTATDVIDQFFIDNMGQASGVWGAVGNAGAMFTSPLITGTGLLQVTTGPPVGGVPGDYNDNGTVDAADYVVWRKNNGTNFQLDNEVETPGQVTAEDYTAWRARFGNTVPPAAGSALGAGAVPEPTTLVLLLAVFAALPLGRRIR